MEPNALDGVRLVTMQNEQGLPCYVCYSEAFLSHENKRLLHKLPNEEDDYTFPSAFQWASNVD